MSHTYLERKKKTFNTERVVFRETITKLKSSIGYLCVYADYNPNGLRISVSLEARNDGTQIVLKPSFFADYTVHSSLSHSLYYKRVMCRSVFLLCRSRNSGERESSEAERGRPGGPNVLPLLSRGRFHVSDANAEL